MAFPGGVSAALSAIPGTAIPAVPGTGTHRHTARTALRALWAGSDDQPPLTVPRDPAREAARRELSKGMYHQNDPGWFQRTVDAVWEWVGDLFDGFSTVTPGGPLGLLVVVLLVVATAGALWWRLGIPHRRPVSAVVLFNDHPRSAAEHRAAAEAHAARGHWNPAVQERMRAVVRSLEERALLDVRPGRTADEAATEAGRSLPAHTDRLRVAARDFDAVTYGGRTATRETYQHVAHLDRDLESARPRLAGSAPGAGHHGRGGAAG